MSGKRNVVEVCQVGDSLALHEPPATWDIRLDDPAGSTLDEWKKAMPGIEVFARADGCARCCAYLCHGLGILWWNGIFQPEQVKWFEGRGQTNGIGDIVRPVAVQRELYIGA